MGKLVSIIIPAYNAEKYIQKCVESVIQQTYRNLEIIIVNDGSNDDTLKKLAQIKTSDERIIVIDQENGGPSAARNAGLKICHGDYIFFLDSDDWLVPNCIEELVNIEERHEVDIIFFDYYKNFAGKDVEHFTYKKDFCYKINQENDSTLLDMRTITPWGKLYSRKCINGVFFDEQMKTAEDVDFNFRVYKQVESAFYTHQCLLHYRILEQSAVHGYDPNVESKFIYPIQKIASYMKTSDAKSLCAYYSFAAIAYIVICQNGVVRNDSTSYAEKVKQIHLISKKNWVDDLFHNVEKVNIPLSRKLIIYFSKIGIYSAIIIAATVRKKLKK